VYSCERQLQVLTSWQLHGVSERFWMSGGVNEQGVTANELISMP
jgi:hypothetical protein